MVLMNTTQLAVGSRVFLVARPEVEGEVLHLGYGGARVRWCDGVIEFIHGRELLALGVRS